ncbi:MAG: helix-turn-helix domain-containing protein [Oscillospiraceae bacterium]|nr:helix-turn-helix domain-containing protein [Oscillospiraceae bacterium]
MSDFNLYESIKQGLTEAIEYERGNLPNVRVDKVTISPLNTYSGSEIREIRIQQKMTQRLFAEAMGVSIKTVEAWEAGTNTPSGVASRMLGLLKQDNGLFEKYSIVARQ